ncbi:MAG: FAD-binding oxidoreductase [Patescibacteria group bacterium]|jgi:NAD(P)H-flavin reductase
MLLTYKTVLSKKVQLNSNTYLFHFDLIDPKGLVFKPGQYVILKVPSNKGPVSRLYSIASSDNYKNSFELIVGLIPGGLASNYLYSLKEKTEVIFQGPAGLFSLRDNNRTKIFLVTGTGIAPVRSIINSKFKFQNSNLLIFWGLKNYKDVYLFEEFKKFNIKICLSREESLNMIPEVDRKYFDLGHINKAVEGQFDNSEFYICGGRNVVESLKLFLIAKNIPLENIIFEKF